MAKITELLNKIMSSRYGRDVRSAIHDSIEAMNEESETAYDAAITAQNSAQASATAAATSATNSKNYADSSETYANNAKQYADSAASIIESAYDTKTTTDKVITNAVDAPMIVTDWNKNGSYEIKSCGKNLLNPKEYIDGKNISNDGDILHAVNTNGDGRLWEYQNANYYFKAQTKTITLVIDVIEPSSTNSAGYVIFAEDDTRILNKDYATLINAGTYKHTLSVESGKTYGLMMKLYTGKVSVALYDSDTSDFEPYKGTSIQVTNDTPSPVFGLESYAGTTHVISDGNITLSYALTETGKYVMQNMKDINDLKSSITS